MPGRGRGRGTMPGRARNTMPGRARRRADQPIPQREAPGAAAAPQAAAWQRGPYPPREEVQAAAYGQPRGAEGGVQAPGEPQLEAGLQALSVRPKRRAGVFQDLVVNTRQNLEHVRLSKTGSEGKAVKLVTNHFRLTCPQLIAYKYNVDFKPDVDDTNLRSQLLFQHERVFGISHIFDGNSLLLSQRLPNQEMEFVSYTLSRSIVKITLQLSKELPPNHPDCVRYYNVLFRRTLRQMNLKQIGRHYYDYRKKCVMLDHGLEVLPGYITSILPYENSLTLCADLSHKLLRLETAYDLIMRLKENNEFAKIKEELVGSIVFTRYNNRTYRVDAIDWNQTPRDTFPKSDGGQITYVQYYKQKYNEYITDFKQPLLVSQGRWKKGRRLMPRSPIRLVPQLCYLTGLTGTIQRGSSIMRELSAKMRPGPMNRSRVLKEFRDSLQVDQNAQRELSRWSFVLDPDFLSISGRTLKEERIFQHKDSFEADPPADWLKGSKSTSLLRAVSLKHWVILHTRNCVSEAKILEENLNSVTPAMGITLEKAKMREVPGNTISSYIDILKTLIEDGPEMVVCILPDDRKNRYDEIKKYLCVKSPIPSQCVVAHTLTKTWTLKTMVVKIAQQMNCKMGGALWKVETGLKKTMFVGIDCFHDIVSRQKSIAGFVASTDEELTKWYSQCIFQAPGEELVDGLKNCLQGALNSWLRNVPHAPESIVVYRDGVGDGQLQALLDHEISELVSYLENECPYSIKLTFIVVKKRINTRFFLKHNRRLGNPAPGTVVDMMVTREQWYDFYIVSQSSTVGTVTPTHYNVIYDTVCLDPDTVQRLTYKLCHMYYNLPGIIRVPAPCHYAHKLAYLVGQSLHDQPSSLLANSLYYL
ncbi:piwi-like protein 3 [Marmota marmota marmota]|uniref:piwi-like protein 3 n=1 Tax=Marmota marmota marmota TaxID=9994 RepID=UPI002091F8C1|nr:piwi-like protein 3 [Marmota marmota marmota]